MCHPSCWANEIEKGPPSRPLGECRDDPGALLTPPILTPGAGVDGIDSVPLLCPAGGCPCSTLSSRRDRWDECGDEMEEKKEDEEDEGRGGGPVRGEGHQWVRGYP